MLTGVTTEDDAEGTGKGYAGGNDDKNVTVD